MGENPHIEVLSDSRTTHVKACVVCIDMASMNETVLKLKQKYNGELVNYQ
jgi:hypothetical protein